MIDEMKELLKSVNRIKSLLEDPQTGMISWNGMLLEAMKDNQKALVSLGLPPQQGE